MKRHNFKRTISFILCIMMVLSSVSISAFAQTTTQGTVLTQVDIKNSPAKPASVFRDNMVLQRNEIVNIWGYAENGKTVTVKFGGQVKTATAKDGRFDVFLDPMDANKTPQTMQFICDGVTFELANILVGEVWFAAGQSNMAFVIEYLSGSLKTEIMNDCNYPEVRVFTQKEIMSDKPRNDVVDGSWKVSSKQTVGKFSTIAFLLARGIHKNLDVPVGIMTAAYGGTRIETHINPVDLRKSGLPVLGGVKDEGVYNAMQNPLKGYTVKGAVWYQGEGNVNPGEYVQYYDDYMGLLINQLRTNFNNPDLPLIQVQLPSFDDPTTNFSDMRFMQMSCDKTIPGVHTVVTYDTGNPTDIHPSDKGPIGERVVSMALEKAYGKTEFDNNYPEADLIEFGEGSATVTFKNANAGLKTTKANVNGLEICGENGKYYQGVVEILADNKIKVTASGVNGKVAGIKYACKNYMKPAEFWSKSNLPVKPFILEQLPEVPDPSLIPNPDDEYKTFINYDKYKDGFKYKWNYDYASYITPEMGAAVPGILNNNGYRGTKSIPIELNKANEKTELIFSANAGYKDGSYFARANEMWVWVDTTDVIFKELWFGLRVGGTYGTHYSTNELDGRNDLVVYIQDGDTWKEKPLNNNGCLENFGNYKGFIRIPTDYIVGQDADDTKADLSKADAFVIGMITRDEDKDKAIQLDNIMFSGPAITGATGTVGNFIEEMNKPLYTPGDVNNDEKINTVDALLILRHVAQINVLTGNNLLAADYNLDKKANTVDALLILRKIAGM